MTRPAPVRLAALVLVLAPLLLPAAAHAQGDAESRLRQHFEGRTVAVRLDMPASEKGVDLYPAEPQPLDYPDYAGRLKQYGIALRPGDRVMVTKIKVKGKLIEFQLGGGGFGTAGDPSPYVSAQTTPKSKREQTLEKQLKGTTDQRERRRIQDELDELRTAREREDARLRAMAEATQERRREHIRELALQSGSRFNLRWRTAVPAASLTPEAVERALERYVDFAPSAGQAATDDVTTAPRRGILGLRKGLLEADVQALLGAPERMSERREGRLRVTTRSYAAGESRVEAEFVEGVLIRYTVSSR
ncbi:MAG TPA: hypothetical protein VFS40_03580 [Gemmatimonadales bacterium]|nr:hypothetical protein [Gemmatimonadales bacterium]